MWGGCRYVVTLPCPKPQVMVLYHQSMPYIKYIPLVESNCWPHITLYTHTTMLTRTRAILLQQNSDLYGVVAGVLWHHHVPRPRLWCYSINLWLIWGIFYWLKAVVGLTKPSMPTIPYSLEPFCSSQILTHKWWLKVCCDITMSQAPGYSVVSSI